MTKNIDGLNPNPKHSPSFVAKQSITDNNQRIMRDISDNNEIKIARQLKQQKKEGISQLQSDKPEVDFLQNYNDRDSVRIPSTASRIFRLFILVLTVAIFLMGSFVFSNYILAQKSNGDLGSALNKLNLWQQITDLFDTVSNAVTPTDRINILLMGMGGPNHDGPYLTDTIILASIKPSTNKLALMSIPRDLYIKYDNITYHKINELYTIGINRNEAEPAQFAATVIGNNFGVEIDYYAVVDFNGFVELIDTLGGISINVDRSFTDNQYPAPKYEYQTISFAQGLQTMDGDTALKYSRSRHGSNGEGSDFARSVRQQKILFAVKDKVLTYNTLLNPYKLNKLYELATDYIDTNISLKDALSLYDEMGKIDFDNIIRHTLDDSPSGLLVSDINNIGAYVLVPKTGYEALQNLAVNIFEYNETANEEAKIAIQNGTKVPGLAYELAQEFWRYDLAVDSYKNAATQDYQRTIIYVFDEKKAKTLQLLQQLLGDVLVSTNIPSHLQLSTDNNNLDDSIDFIIILGQDRAYYNKLNQINE